MGLLNGLIVCAALFGAGCAASGDPESSTEADGPTAEAGEKATTLASLKVVDNEVSFVALEGEGAERTLAVLERSPSGEPAWTNQLVGATFLEMFLALAPEGTEPPTELVDAQSLQAAQLGRDAAIHRFSVDLKAPIQKDVSSCYTSLPTPQPVLNSPANWRFVGGADTNYPSAPSGMFTPSVGGTTQWLSMRVCNLASVNVDTDFLYVPFAGSPTFTTRENLGPGGWNQLIVFASAQAYVRSTGAFQVSSKAWRIFTQ